MVEEVLMGCMYDFYFLRIRWVFFNGVYICIIYVYMWLNNSLV